jgi:Na+-driven multidrug efflux pump
MLATYFLQGAMNAVLGTVRGLGYSMAPLILNIVGTCVTRSVWVFLIFPLEPFHTFSGLALLYPVSWGASALLLAIITVVAFRRLARIEAEAEAKAGASEKTLADA